VNIADLVLMLLLARTSAALRLVHDGTAIVRAYGAGLAVRPLEVVMATGPAADAVEAVKERLAPTLDKLDETIRQGRQVVVRGQHAAEDAAAATALRIRRRPLSAVMIAAGAGALVGALIGFGLASVTRCRE
jgi:ElaB/YqjD/DUF883 family membrane-anchored ribosome-binding protein